MANNRRDHVPFLGRHLEVNAGAKVFVTGLFFGLNLFQNLRCLIEHSQLEIAARSTDMALPIGFQGIGVFRETPHRRASWLRSHPVQDVVPDIAHLPNAKVPGKGPKPEFLIAVCGFSLSAKRSHGGQGVHIVPPSHDLAVLDRNDRDEAVVVGGTVPDYFAVYLVFDNHDTGILRSVRNERIRAMQDDVVAIAQIERYERLTAIKSLGPSWENISKLEHRVVWSPSTRPARPCWTMSKKGSSALKAAHIGSVIISLQVCRPTLPWSTLAKNPLENVADRHALEHLSEIISEKRTERRRFRGRSSRR